MTSSTRVLPSSAEALSRRHTTVDQVQEMMLAAIVNGELSAGQEMRDHSWATQLHVSRTPIREAIKRLESHGIVEISAARYTRIANFTPEKARHEARDWAAIHLALVITLCGSADRTLISRLNAASERTRTATELPQYAANFSFFTHLRTGTTSFSIHLGAFAVAYRLRLALPHLPEHADADTALHAQIITALQRGAPDALEPAFTRWTHAATRD